MIDPSKIWSSPQLPTLPTVAIRLIELSKQPELEIRDVLDLIKLAPAISAKIPNRQIRRSSASRLK
jgi:HD-like signal output (HDOD) protein